MDHDLWVSHQMKPTTEQSKPYVRDAQWHGNGPVNIGCDHNSVCNEKINPTVTTNGFADDRKSGLNKEILIYR